MIPPSKPPCCRHIQRWLPSVTLKGNTRTSSPASTPTGPDDEVTTELPRLFRFLPEGAIPDGPHVICLYLKKLNLVIINKDIYETLSDEDKLTVLRTQHTLTID